MCFRNQSCVCPHYPDMEVLPGQPSISSFNVLLAAPGQWWALGMVHQSKLGVSGILVLKLHLNNNFCLVGGGVSCY